MGKDHGFSSTFELHVADHKTDRQHEVHQPACEKDVSLVDLMPPCLDFSIPSSKSAGKNLAGMVLRGTEMAQSLYSKHTSRFISIGANASLNGGIPLQSTLQPTL